MNITEKIKIQNKTIVRIDKSLNKYDDKILFPDKLEKANEVLKKIGVPEQWMLEKSHS